jgi:hypothetical protein
MQLKGLKETGCLLIFLFLLSGLASTAHATTLSPANGTTFTAANQFQPYTSTTLRAGGCLLPLGYDWTATGLPAGLALNSTTGTTNTITGTPTVSGTFSFSVTVNPRGGIACGNVTNTYHLTINPRCKFSGTGTGSILFASIDPTTSPGPIYNTSVSQQINFLCGPGTTYSYTLLPSQPKLSGAKNTSGIPFTLSAGNGLAAIGGNTSDTTVIGLLTTTSQISRTDYQNAYAETDTSGTITVTINWTGAAAGSIAATVTASGTVINACSVTGSSVLNFGTLDADINFGTVPATVTPPSLICTRGDNISVTNNGGQNYSGSPRLKSGMNYINYNLTYTTPLTGAGGTTDIGGSGAGHLAMGATISAGAINGAPAGTYNDIVILTISY